MLIALVWIPWQVFTDWIWGKAQVYIEEWDILAWIVQNPWSIAALAILAFSVWAFLATRKELRLPRISKNDLLELRQTLYEIQQCSGELENEAAKYDLSSYMDKYFTDKEWFNQTSKKFDSNRTQLLYQLAQFPSNPRLAELKEESERWKGLMSKLDELVPKIHYAKLENNTREYIRRLNWTSNAKLWQILHKKHSTSVGTRSIAEDEELLDLLTQHPLRIYRQIIKDIDQLIEEGE